MPDAGGYVSEPRLHAVKLTLHSWELPSWPREHLRASTAGALRIALNHYYPETKVEIAYDAAPDETVVDQYEGKESRKGAKLECDVRGGMGERERHMFQHQCANTIEGIMRRTLQIFIEHDAVNRYHKMKAAYQTYDDREPGPAKGRILT